MPSLRDHLTTIIPHSVPRLTVFLIALLFLSGSAPLAFSQSAPADSALLQQSIQQVSNRYRTEMHLHSHLYNGSEYVDYDNYIDGHQYFESDELEDGVVHYDGALYQGVPLLYDVRLDQVITENLAGPLRIRLVSEKVRYFTLLNHTFVRIVADSTQQGGVRTGFYDQLYDGNVQVLAKRVKLIHEQVSSGRVEKHFYGRDRHFIRKAGQFYPVKRKSSVLRVFDDRKKELQKFLREQKIRFKQNPEATMVQLARQYDALTKSL
jgi:hypothetical protein